MKDVVHRHAASPLSRLRPGEQNNKVSQPPEACRRKLDHLYAISTSSPPLGGVFIVAYFCGQYNQELQPSPLKTAKSLPAARLFPQETSAANAVCHYDPTREKVPRENPQIFPGDKFKIIIPLNMRKAHAARIPNRPLTPPQACGKWPLHACSSWRNRQFLPARSASSCRDTADTAPGWCGSGQRWCTPRSPGIRRSPAPQ